MAALSIILGITFSDIVRTSAPITAVMSLLKSVPAATAASYFSWLVYGDVSNMLSTNASMLPPNSLSIVAKNAGWYLGSTFSL